MKSFAVCGTFLFVFTMCVAGCNEPNPFYLGTASPIDDAGVGVADADGADALDIPASDAALLLPDAAVGDGGVRCSPAICEANFGKPPCGVWSCANTACQVTCVNCQDKDHDGFGQGEGCAAADCDDNNPKIRDEVASQSCYEGPNGTIGKGACHAGVASCEDGVWSECAGQRMPLGESCNNQDDDCNSKVDDLPSIACGLGVCRTSATACSNQGAAMCMPKPQSDASDDCGNGDEDCDGTVDEDCTKCVRVSAFGIDALADGITKPFRTIQAAVNWAAADTNRPQQVCVAASATCAQTGTSPVVRFMEGDGRSLTMHNGVSVLGGFESTTWTQCDNNTGEAVPRNAPILTVRSAEGILFPETISKPTSLAGFIIERTPPGKNSTAITVRGAKGATIANVKVLPTKGMDNSVGVSVIGNADAVIARSHINVGDGSVSAVAIAVKDSSVSVLDNCGSFDGQGRCKAACAGEGTALWAGTAENKGGEAIAVLLAGATSASLANNGMCAGAGKESAGVKVTGASANTVINGNVIRAVGGATLAAAVWFAGCGGGQPWLVNNESIAASAGSEDTKLSGVRSEGDCLPRVESNVLIGVSGISTKNAYGVHCVGNACQILRNEQIRGSAAGSTEISAGIRCESKGCGSIIGNRVIDAGRGKRTFGLWLEEGSPHVQGNVIQGGCGSASSTGIYAVDNGSRIDNNVIFGATCENNLPVVQPTGVGVVTGQTKRSADLHSNTIDTARGGGVGNCTGATLSVSTKPDTEGGTAGRARNNIFSHHGCKGAIVQELDAKSHLLELDANLFDEAFNFPVFLSDGKDVFSLGELNKNNASAVRRNNLQGDPKYIAWPNDLHLDNGSAAIDKGTTSGAPKQDHEAHPRDAKPDIGAFEHQ